MSQSNHKKPVPLNQTARDLWDDTLLIKKYDESLKLASEEVAKRIAQSTNTDDPDSETAAESAGQVSTGPLQVGDYVRCTFSEDGIDYEAQIVSIRGESCLIRYVGYNNEETVDIGALIPSWGADVRDEQIRASGTTDTAAVGSTAHTDDEKPSASGSGTLKTKKTKHNKQQKTFDRVRASMMIPPPPPLPPMEDDDGDSEHMSSMLMAWYMSGYYTGLYQGQKLAKQSKKE